MHTMVIGNLCGDPVFRQTRREGRPMARFVVAQNRRRRVGEEFVDGTPVFHRVICYGGLAENVSNTLRKGMEVLAAGEWVDDSYNDDQGERRTQIALEARTIGPGLRWAVAEVTKIFTPALARSDPGSDQPAESALSPTRVSPSPTMPSPDAEPALIGGG